jgi:regulator of replication initiation timing
MKSELKRLGETVDKLSNKIDMLATAVHPDLSTDTMPMNATYASVTSAPSARTVQVAAEQHIRPDHPPNVGRERDPVKAMYLDLNLKKQRANNIVISGMPPTQSPDHETKAVVELLASEFDWDRELWPGVSVVRCRRLGQPQEGKCQPLLVTLDTQMQAEFYIKNARELRNSSQSEVRKNVFINPDLTQAEARAAYELRQRRKQRRQESDSKRQGSHNNSSRTFYPSGQHILNLDLYGERQQPPVNMMLMLTFFLHLNVLTLL